MARTESQIPFLLEQLKSDDGRIRNVALYSIRDLASEELAAELNREVLQVKGDLRVQLIAAIRDCSNDQSGNVLIPLLNDPDPAVRFAAVDAFSRLCRPHNSPALVMVLAHHAGSPEAELAWERLALLDHASIDNSLIIALSSTTASPEARLSFIGLLGERKTAKASDTLLKAAAGDDEQISVAAYQSLKPIAGANEVDRLIAQTRNHQNERAREAAEFALFNACQNSADASASAAKVFEALKSAASSADRLSWTRVLSLLGYAPALDGVAEGLKDSNADVVIATIQHLGAWPNPLPVPSLLEFAEASSTKRFKTRALLAALDLAAAAADKKESNPQTLFQWLNQAATLSSSAQEKRKIISALGRLHQAEAIRLLMEFADDETIRVETAFALVSACEPITPESDKTLVKSALAKIENVDNAELQKRINRLREALK